MEFIEKDNITGIKKQLKLLFYAFPVEPHPQIPFFCSHPFTDSMHVFSGKHPSNARLLDLNKKEDLN